eukprot:gene7750-15854_t
MSSFRWYISVVVEQVITVSRLLAELTRFVIVGTRTWIVMFVRLVCFVIILIPGWVELLRYWIYDPSIIRNVEFGRGYRFRNVLDVYLPYSCPSTSSTSENLNKATIIVLMSGGAWIIGYKFWSALIAKSFARMGLVVVVPDYRNFPQGDIEDMCDDLRQALLWVIVNADCIGGDPNKIVLAGQSAGAHICMCTLLDLYENKEAEKLSTRNMAMTTQHSCNNNNDHDVKSESKEYTSHSHYDSQSHSGRSSPTWRTVGGTASDDGLYGLEDNDNNDITIDTDIDNKEDFHTNHNSILHINNLKGDDVEVDVEEEEPDTVDCEFKSHSSMSESDIDILGSICLFVGISGPYDLVHMQSHLHTRGLDSSILSSVCRGDVCHYSPTLRISELVLTNEKELKERECLQFADKKYVNNNKNQNLHHHPHHHSHKCLQSFPPVALFHGCRDHSIPASVSMDFARVLRNAGVRTSLVLYSDWGHTEAILEGPLSGDESLAHDVRNCVVDVLQNKENNSESMFSSNHSKILSVSPSDAQPLLEHVLHAKHRMMQRLSDKENRSFQSKPMVPDSLINLARFVNPF